MNEMRHNSGAIPRMIEGTQFGSIQAYCGPMDFLTGVDPRYEVFGAPALFESPAQVQKTLEDPEVAVDHPAVPTLQCLGHGCSPRPRRIVPPRSRTRKPLGATAAGHLGKCHGSGD